MGAADGRALVFGSDGIAGTSSLTLHCWTYLSSVMSYFIIASRLALHSASQSSTIAFELCPFVVSGTDEDAGGTVVEFDGPVCASALPGKIAIPVSAPKTRTRCFFNFRLLLARLDRETAVSRRLQPSKQTNSNVSCLFLTVASFLCGVGATNGKSCGRQAALSLTAEPCSHRRSIFTSADLVFSCPAVPSSACRVLRRGCRSC